jgi:hypothetical protein
MIEKHQPVYKSTFTVPYLDSLAMEKQSQMREEILPFTVRIVQDEEDLAKAIRVRHSAYARHLPTLAATLREPEALDRAEGVVILLAESKLDGTPIGSARLQSNQFQSLAVEQSIELPDWLDGKSIIEVTRLAITEGKAGRLVKSLLMKAMYQYWIENNIDYVIATGRAPIDMLYDQLLFNDLYPDQGYIPMRHVGNVPHRVMAVCVETLQQRWEAVSHPLIKLVLHTYHPDINIFNQQYANVVKPLCLIPNPHQNRLRA